MVLALDNSRRELNSQHDHKILQVDQQRRINRSRQNFDDEDARRHNYKQPPHCKQTYFNNRGNNDCEDDEGNDDDG